MKLNMSKVTTVANGISNTEEYSTKTGTCNIKKEPVVQNDSEFAFDPSIVKEEMEDLIVTASTCPTDITENYSVNLHSPSHSEKKESCKKCHLPIRSSPSSSDVNLDTVQIGSSLKPKQQGKLVFQVIQQGNLPFSTLSAPKVSLNKEATDNQKVNNSAVESATSKDFEKDPLDVDESSDEGSQNPTESDSEGDDKDDSTAVQESTELDCSLPNLMNETGKYGFKIILDEKEDTLKTPTWLMSKITKKLYTNMNKPVPFRVILKKRYPKKLFYLRAMAVFKYPMFLRQNVVRCPNHLNPSDPSNVEFIHTNHVIRADHPRAEYMSNAAGRLSVLIPLAFPENSCEAIPVLLKFMCHNSCVGGISRRPLAVLLSLEHNAEEVGRYTVDVRVCACPSRDVKTEENHVMVKGMNKKMNNYFYEDRGRKRPKKEVFEDENLYFLQIRGLKLYKYLQEMKMLYLKTHPEYAAQYPDVPPSDGVRSELENEDVIVENEESMPQLPDCPSPLPDTPPSSQPFTPLLSSMSSQEIPIIPQKSLILIYSKTGDQEGNNASTSSVLSRTTKCKSLVTLKSTPNSELPPLKKVKSEHVEEIQHSETQNKNLSEKLTSPPPSSHLQVRTMPRNIRSSKILARIPKRTERGTTVKSESFLKRALQNSPNSQELLNDENEKVLLAAEVLATNLGSNKIRSNSKK